MTTIPTNTTPTNSTNLHTTVTVSLMVDCCKIITWLDSRKKLKPNWYESVKAAQQKMKQLIKTSFPQYPLITTYLNDNSQNFNYNDVQWISQHLLQTPLAQQRSLLSGYTDPRMKQWIQLRNYMSKNDIGLLNTAKWLEQVLLFQLPGLYGEINRLEQQLTHLKRKIDYNYNTIHQQKEAMLREKIQLGLPQNDLSIEQIVTIMVNNVPNNMLKLQQLMKKMTIKEGIDLWKKVQLQNCTNQLLSNIQRFLEYGDQFVAVATDSTRRQVYAAVQKYTVLKLWQCNAWSICELSNQHKQSQQSQQSQSNSSSLDPITILEKLQTRHALLHELDQLLYFFLGLSFEFTAKIDNRGELTEDVVNNTIVDIENVIRLFTNRAFTMPIEIVHSKTAEQTFISHFASYEANIVAMQKQIRLYRDQIVNVQTTKQILIVKLRSLSKRAYESKSICEKWLSEIAKKDVKITGKVNNFE